MRAVGYARVSTRRQGEGGLGMEAQEAAIRAWAEAGGYELAGIETDVASGRTTRRRPGLDAALTQARDGAEVLVVAKLDRLSRSVIDFALLVETAQREGWALVVLDIGVDLTTPHGRLVAGVLASVAQWERELIGQRTRAALAEARAGGTRLGRPRAVAPEVERRIRRRRRAGWTLARIADALQDEGAPTAHGGARWHASTVRAVLARAG